MYYGWVARRQPQINMGHTEASQEPDNGVNSAPLPLFRSEALRAPEKFYGEILSIRPLPAIFCACLAIGITMAASSLLIFGRYTETTRVRGILAQAALDSAPPSATSRELEAVVRVADRSRPQLQPGAKAVLRCLRTGTTNAASVEGTILHVSSGRNAAEDAPGISTLRIRLALAGEGPAPPTRNDWQPGAAVELAIPGESKSILSWLRERSGR